MSSFASVDDVTRLFRELNLKEIERTEHLLEVVSDMLRVEAKKVGKDLDTMLEGDNALKNTAKAVVVDIVARTLMTSTNQEPVLQSTESALGYSHSATYLVPGGGIFIKNAELSRLGLRRQRFGVMEIYG